MDVAVLGGGIVGASTAYELAVAGAHVALIDASFPGRASDAGAGIVSPETFADADEEWVAFGQLAAAHLRSLVGRLAEDGIETDNEVFAQCGSLVVAQTEHEDRWFSEVAARACARRGGVTEISATDARSIFPLLGEVWRALHSPTAARVDGRRLSRALRDGARRRGVDVVTTPAVGFERRGDRVVSVVGMDETVGCGAVVVACGAWSADAARWAGVELPVSPTKGQIVHLGIRTVDEAGRAAPRSSAQWPIVQPVFNFYLVPWPGDRVACGGTFEPQAGFDDRPTASGVRDLLREAVAIAPGLADATLLEVRVGLRPTSADDRPLLGPLPGATNVHICTGHGANGLLMGPFSGALAARAALGEPTPEAGAYTMARFVEQPPS